jgi:nucleoside phosphorylase
MYHNLTDKQKDDLKSLVQLGRSWLDEFVIIWHEPAGPSDILDFDGDPPQISRGNIEALARDGLLICRFRGSDRARVTLIAESYEAVDSDFGATGEVKGQSELQQLLTELIAVEGLHFHHHRFRRWHYAIRLFLRRTYGEDSYVVKQFNDIVWNTSREDTDEQRALFAESCTQAMALLEALVREQQTPSQPVSERVSRSEVDFLVVTALEEEQKAVLNKLPDHKRLDPSGDDIRVYYLSELATALPEGSTGVYRIVVSLLGKGRTKATTAAADAIRRWQPRHVILVGIAGGIAAQEVKLGDILVSDQIVDYELRKLTPGGSEYRWEVYRANPRLIAAASNLARADWLELVGEVRPDSESPTRHIGPTASGDELFAFRQALDEYRTHWPQLLGVEMEGAGVAAACAQAAEPPGFFMIRGVSDFADEEKNTDRVRRWRPYACDIAASYMVALLKNGPVILQTTESSSSTDTARR